MELKIIWSEFAESQLDEIYHFYEKEVSPEFANKFVNEIINEPNKLVNTPFIGQEEDMLRGRKIQYRYLVYKSYKLIYSVDLENKYIKIADVFDTRRNPPKIKRSM